MWVSYNLCVFETNLQAVQVLWGFPVLLSAAPRLARIATALGSGGLSLMVDHPEQLKGVQKVCELSGVAPDIYIKIDMGTKRSGVVPGSQIFSQLVSDLLTAEESGSVVFVGLYSHAGHSYSGDDRAAALDLLRQEFEALLAAADVVQSGAKNKRLILTVGATPTTTSVRNLLLPDAVMTADEQTAIAAVRATVDAIKRSGCSIEIHAGVYPVLDLQQLSTHALSSDGAYPMLSWKDMALTVLTEVASLYPSRGPNGTTEALIAAGNLALGREPCKAYNGWGIVSPWNISGARVPDDVPEKHAEWQIRKISQEHGILSWAGAPGDEIPLTIGQKLRIWPNHACIAAAGFDWYLIVDSELAGREDEVIDVWPRWRGW
jgi:D-serine deaminase-like pyridoxal phosphate-dependent protein